MHRGSLDDPESLKRGAEASDGVIHTAYNHDFFFNSSGEDFASLYTAAAESDRRAIETMGRRLPVPIAPWSSPPGPHPGAQPPRDGR